MWKKKTPFRRRWRKGPTTSSLAKTKASKRYNWIEALDASCTPAYLLPHICAEDGEELNRPVDMDCVTGVANLVDPVSPTRIVLVPPADPAQTAEDAYASDDVSVVRIVGHVLLQPTWTFTDAALAIINGVSETVRPALINQLLAQRHYWLRAGLRKETMILDPATHDYTWPRRDPLDSLEWVDGRYVRQWERETMPGELGSSTSTLVVAGSVLGCCSNVTGTGGGGGSAINTLTDGSGNIDTEIDDIDVSTVCEPCLVDPNDLVTTGVVLAAQKPIKLSLNSRRRFRLRENEGLQMVINYTAVDYPSNAFASCYPGIGHYTGVGFLARPHIKILIET